MILDFCNFKEKQDHKKMVIFKTLLDFYKKKNECEKLSIPYFLSAKSKYNELIKNNKDVNYFYKIITEG